MTLDDIQKGPLPGGHAVERRGDVIVGRGPLKGGGTPTLVLVDTGDQSIAPHADALEAARLEDERGALGKWRGGRTSSADVADRAAAAGRSTA